MLVPLGGRAVEPDRGQDRVTQIGALLAHHQAARVLAVLDGVVPEIEQAADRLGATPGAAEQDDIGGAGDEVPLPPGRGDGDLDRHRAQCLPRQPPLPVVLGKDDARSNVGGGSRPTDDGLDLRLVDDQAVELVLGDDGGDGGAVLAVLDGIAADFLQLGVLSVDGDGGRVGMLGLEFVHPFGDLGRP